MLKKMLNEKKNWRGERALIRGLALIRGYTAHERGNFVDFVLALACLVKETRPARKLPKSRVDGQG